MSDHGCSTEGVWLDKPKLEACESTFHANLYSTPPLEQHNDVEESTTSMEVGNQPRSMTSNIVACVENQTEVHPVQFGEKVFVATEAFSVWYKQAYYETEECLYYLPAKKTIAVPKVNPVKKTRSNLAFLQSGISLQILGSDSNSHDDNIKFKENKNRTVEDEQRVSMQTENDASDGSQQVCWPSMVEGVWLDKLKFDQSELEYGLLLEERRKSKKPRPFKITRKPPVASRFVPEGEKAHNSETWTELLQIVQEQETQTSGETAMREDYVKLLTRMIQNADPMFKDATLSVFGSTHNGFGNSGSDLDLVLHYPDPLKDPVNKTNTDLINILAKALNKPHFFDIIHVTQVIRGARVPIIKFVSTSRIYPGLNGDICARNQLGPRNTKLMSAYASYDERLRTLGYGIKKFAKLANINDASTGSLSSYGYLIMMIYYLQRTTPAILPCLQSPLLRKEGETPLRKEDFMNTWYQEDLDYVRGVVSHQKNTSSVGDLWKGFFEFFTNFDYRTQIDIRFKTQSTYRRVAIEIRDPFDEDHDLARVLKLSGENLLRNCFFSAINLFNRLEVLETNISSQSKLQLFEWLVEQVANSHPFGKMSTCWNCGEGDHYKSVCHIYRERRLAEERMRNDDETSKRRNRSSRQKKKTTNSADENAQRQENSKRNEVANHQQRLKPQLNPEPKLLQSINTMNGMRFVHPTSRPSPIMLNQAYNSTYQNVPLSYYSNTYAANISRNSNNILNGRTPSPQIYNNANARFPPMSNSLQSRFMADPANESLFVAERNVVQHPAAAAAPNRYHQNVNPGYYTEGRNSQSSISSSSKAVPMLQRPPLLDANNEMSNSPIYGRNQNRTVINSNFVQQQPGPQSQAAYANSRHNQQQRTYQSMGMGMGMTYPLFSNAMYPPHPSSYNGVQSNYYAQALPPESFSARKVKHPIDAAYYQKINPNGNNFMRPPGF